MYCTRFKRLETTRNRICQRASGDFQRRPKQWQVSRPKTNGTTPNVNACLWNVRMCNVLTWQCFLTLVVSKQTSLQLEILSVRHWLNGSESTDRNSKRFSVAWPTCWHTYIDLRYVVFASLSRSHFPGLVSHMYRYFPSAYVFPCFHWTITNRHSAPIEILPAITILRLSVQISFLNIWPYNF